MSILARFVTGNADASVEQYDGVISRMKAEGMFPPEGMSYHVAFMADGRVNVSEIWDSREQLDAFAPRLMPVLAEMGVELARPPEIFEIHNIVAR